MAEILPFKALRYDTTQVDLSDVLTQPYDKITPEMQSRYYDQSPYNVVRIEHGKAGATDRDDFNAYTRAAEYLHDWRSSNVLRLDAGPGFYVYAQTFNVPGLPDIAERRCLIALGRIHNYSDNVIFPSEQTLSRPKTDRLNLLRATRAQFDQILMLHSDEGGELQKLLRQTTEIGADVSLRDEAKTLHRLWQLSDPASVALIRAFTRDKKLMIADGHHLYDTALEYRDERRAQASTADANAPYEFTMMALASMEDRGLVILPTHRIVHGLPSFDRERMLDQAKTYFDIDRIDLRAESRSATTLLSEAGESGTAFVAVTRQGPYLMRAKKRVIQESMSEVPEDQRSLDVVQLHKILFERVLGIGEEAVRDEENVRFERDAFEAISWVRQGANVAFLMNPARIEQVREVAFSGSLLPQKSTDFYPKLLSGFAIYAME